MLLLTLEVSTLEGRKEILYQPKSDLFDKGFDIHRPSKEDGECLLKTRGSHFDMRTKTFIQYEERGGEAKRDSREFKTRRILTKPSSQR